MDFETFLTIVLIVVSLINLVLILVNFWTPPDAPESFDIIVCADETDQNLGALVLLSITDGVARR